MAPSTTSPSSTPQNGTKETSSQPILYELQPLTGKGFGLLATQDIKAGMLIISEAPILKTDVITSTDMVITEKELRSAHSKLSKEDQKRFLALHNNFHDEFPLAGIVRSNAYPLGADADVGGVFLTVSRINHSCFPNGVQYWNPLLEKQTIYAIRGIKAGEEITTSYHSGGPSTVRKQILKTHFGFHCTCELCSLPEDELRKSDERLVEAANLDERIGDPKLANYQPEEVLKAARKLLNLFNEERIQDGRLSRLYYDCFQTVNMHGDLARARCFAKYYLDTKKVAEGPDSLNVLEMKQYVKKPEEHESFGSTERWKTKGSEVPKGRNWKEFARWLWRENV